MSVGESIDVTALASKVEFLEKQVAACANEERLGRRIRSLLLLCLLVFVLGFGWLYYRKGAAFLGDDNLKKLGAMAQARLTDKSNEKRFRDEAQKMLDNVQTPVSNAFSDRLKKDSPEFVKRLEHHRDILVSNMPKRLSAQVEVHYGKLLGRNQRILENEFPEIKDERAHETMTTNLALALKPILKRYYADPLEAEMEKLVKIWDSFPPAADSRAGEKRLEDELYDQLLEFLWLRIEETLKAAPMK